MLWREGIGWGGKASATRNDYDVSFVRSPESSVADVCRLVNRRQLDVIEYLQEENRVLKERLGGRSLRFADVERRRFARKAQALGRKTLNALDTLVAPDTLLRWYRELVAAKWTYTPRRGPGRPRVMKTITDLILRMALENPSCGYTRIRGALANLGHEVGRGTIASILKENGIVPAPERSKNTRWSTFLKAHWECLTATDFLSVEVCTFKGLVTYHIPLFFINIGSRSIHIAGLTPDPGSTWMMQVARNVTDVSDGFRPSIVHTSRARADRSRKRRDARASSTRVRLRSPQLRPQVPGLGARQIEMTQFRAKNKYQYPKSAPISKLGT
jgi:hypothetical protein